MQTLDLEKVLLEYQTELNGDTKVDELTIKEKIMIMPTLKHKWVARLMTYKVTKQKLVLAKKKAIRELVSSSPIPLTKTSLDQAVGKNDTIGQINDLMDSVDIIIEYLEKAEKLTNSMTWDCKNLIDIQKLETT